MKRKLRSSRERFFLSSLELVRFLPRLRAAPKGKNVHSLFLNKSNYFVLAQLTLVLSDEDNLMVYSCRMTRSVCNEPERLMNREVQSSLAITIYVA